MVDTLEAMIGKVIEEAEMGRDAVSLTTEIESAVEPPPRIQPPVAKQIHSTSSSGVKDSVTSGILGQREAGTSATRREPIGLVRETKMGGDADILLDAVK